MTHLAIDLALGTSGFCWGPRPVDRTSVKCPAAAKRGPFGQRLRYWRKVVREFLAEDKEPRIIAVYVEAPFMWSKNPNGAIETIKLHGAIEHLVNTEGIPYDDSIQNTSVPALLRQGTGLERKQFDDVKEYRMAIARARFGWDGTSHDEADALLLWHYVAELKQRGAA